LDAIGTAATNADTATTTAISGNSIVPQLQLLQSTAAMTLPITASYMEWLAIAAEDNLSVVDSWSRVAADSLMGFGNTLPILDSLLAKLSSVSAAASSATSAVNGLPSSPPSAGGQTIPEKAEGGLANGLFSAGEAGKEYISTDTQVAVLNNQSTTAIDRAVQSVLGGMGVGRGMTKNVNVYLNQIYHVQSPAQAVDAAQVTANQVRGFW
ncbi:MAG TPA: hypothetical protein VHO69_14945, partial [Phototrophicaceae bacterium]|nr:hypothetical protein [Phototrophicaceae bacterium]